MSTTITLWKIVESHLERMPFIFDDLNSPRAFDKALKERRGIARFGSAYAPLDEALSRSVSLLHTWR